MKRKGGRPGKSPKTRAWLKRHAEKRDKPRKDRTDWHGSVADLMKGGKRART